MKDNKEKGWFSRHRITVSIIALILIGVLVYLFVTENIVKQKVVEQFHVNATLLESQLVSSAKNIEKKGEYDIRDVKASFIDGTFGKVSITIDAEPFYASTEGIQKDFVYGVATTYNAICKENGLTLGCDTEIHSETGRIIASATGRGEVKIY
ncbi:MAG TPA: hypothetical protein VKE88_01750 [Candidatus Nanoarchaeia archaeon]|nr:hypothetical protein [Candidatus Nanoarchaeia archaeon]